MKRKVVVTGGSGFLGRKISDRLRSEGFHVYQMAMPEEKVKGDNFFMGNIANPNSFDFPETDIVIHCAGILESSHPTDELMFKVNYEGTKNVYKKGKLSGMKKFIMISTVSSIGPKGKRGIPMTEDTEPEPDDPYGKSKRSAEKFLLENSKRDNITTIILRPTVLYGEGMNIRSSGMKTFTSLKKGIMPLVGGGNTIYNLLYVDNFVDAIITACIKGNGVKIYNVSEGPYTLSQVIETIENDLGKKGHIRMPRTILYLLTKVFQLLTPFIKGPPPVSMAKYRGLTTNIWHLSAERIERELGWKPVIDLKTGVKRTIEYYGMKDTK